MLDSLPRIERDDKADLRIPITTHYKDMGSLFVLGKVCTGRLIGRLIGCLLEAGDDKHVCVKSAHKSHERSNTIHSNFLLRPHLFLLRRSCDNSLAGVLTRHASFSLQVESGTLVKDSDLILMPNNKKVTGAFLFAGFR